MFSYMAGKDDVGSYKKTFEISLKEFASKNPAEMAKNSGALFDPGSSVINLTSLGQSLDVKYPEGTVRFSGMDRGPLFSWRLIILNHLWRADGSPVTNRLISYRELENGNVFYPAFARESINPLVEKLSPGPADRIKKACLKFDACLEDKADVCAVFNFLPRFPVTVKIWLKDEEMSGSANILFDAGANRYVHTEDIAVVGNLVSYFLIRQYELEE